MAGEDIKDFTVMKFNKKLREEEKRDFNKNFISGNTDYEEKIDLLNRMRRTSTSWAVWKSTRTRREFDVHAGRGRTSRGTSSTPGSCSGRSWALLGGSLGGLPSRGSLVGSGGVFCT